VVNKFPTSKSVVLTAQGPSFSAGADLNWMQKMVNYTEKENEQDSLNLYDMVHSIRTCEIPVISRVTGSAFGGGCGLIAATDFSFALSNAKFGFTEVKLGIVPAVISPFVMEKIGAGNCSRFFLTGERFSAEEAKRIGLIQDHFATEAELDQMINKMLAEISSSGPNAVKTCKKLIHNVAHVHSDYSLPTTRSYVTSVIAKARVSKEGQERILSFLSKSKGKKE
jgi:methylglutaconyl-CoA hydratase